MTDVFISYKREDFARVAPLAEALSAEGLSVWWDVEIRAGEVWRHAITAALDSARCVLVLWTELSAGPQGEFVQDEAAYAKARGKYLPVTLDPVSPPLGFGQVQCLSLMGWSGERAAADYRNLLAAVRRQVNNQPAAAPGKADAPLAGKIQPQSAALARSRPGLALQPLELARVGDDVGEFAEVLLEDLSSALALSPLLSLVKPTAAADYRLQGRARVLGGKLRLSFDLLHCESGATAWSSRSEILADALFDGLQDTVARLVGGIEPAILRSEEGRAFETAALNLDFWRLFVEGRRLFWMSSPTDVHKAEALLTRALELKPDDPSTLSLLAHCSLFEVWVGSASDPLAAIEAAYVRALRAVACDGSDSFGHYTLGVVLSLKNRWEDASAEQRRALELNPYLAAALGELGRIHAFEGEWEEAIQLSDRAIAISPDDAHAWLWFRSKAIARFIAGDYIAAARDAVDACTRGPHRFYLHILLSACYAAAERMEDAARCYAEAQAISAREDEQARRSRKTASGSGETALRIGHPFRRKEDMDKFLLAVRAARQAASL